MSALRAAYLALAVIGAALGLWGLFQQTNAPIAYPGLWVAGAAFTLWVLAEVQVRRNWIALAVLPAWLVLGPACALPLYLFLRTRKIA